MPSITHAANPCRIGRGSALRWVVGVVSWVWCVVRECVAIGFVAQGRDRDYGGMGVDLG